MAGANESAASLRWLLDGIGEPLADAWAEVRDRMRTPTGQTVVVTSDWIADPWVAKGIEPADFLPTAAPMYNPPDEVDAWPDLRVATTCSALSLPVRPTRHSTVHDLIAALRAGSADRERLGLYW